ncbi:MAG: hypothetical protein HYZ28_27765 [Myxococcales bacterium]|nr:hypothetical protein [Myxococcales bacterium]
MAHRRAHTARGALTACPRCGSAGRSVGRETLQSVLKPEATLRLLAFKPRFCRSRDCDVLYYGARWAGGREAGLDGAGRHQGDRGPGAPLLLPRHHALGHSARG